MRKGRKEQIKGDGRKGGRDKARERRKTAFDSPSIVFLAIIAKAFVIQ